MSETKCCGQVYDRNGHWGRFNPCTKKAKVEREGKWYCGTHDPVRLDAIRAASEARWNAEAVASAKKHRLESAANDLAEACEAAWNCIVDLPPSQSNSELVRMLSDALRKARGES